MRLGAADGDRRDEAHQETNGKGACSETADCSSVHGEDSKVGPERDCARVVS